MDYLSQLIEAEIGEIEAPPRNGAWDQVQHLWVAHQSFAGRPPTTPTAGSARAAPPRGRRLRRRDAENGASAGGPSPPFISRARPLTVPAPRETAAQRPDAESSKC